MIRNRYIQIVMSIFDCIIFMVLSKLMYKLDTRSPSCVVCAVIDYY